MVSSRRGVRAPQSTAAHEALRAGPGRQRARPSGRLRHGHDARLAGRGRRDGDPRLRRVRPHPAHAAGDGTFWVYSTVRYNSVKDNPNVKLDFMMRFAIGDEGLSIGFHAIPRNPVRLHPVDLDARSPGLARLCPPGTRRRRVPLELGRDRHAGGRRRHGGKVGAAPARRYPRGDPPPAVRQPVGRTLRRQRRRLARSGRAQRRAAASTSDSARRLPAAPIRRLDQGRTMAESMAWNLAWVSASSASGSLSATIPPPANSRAGGGRRTARRSGWPPPRCRCRRRRPSRPAPP